MPKFHTFYRLFIPVYLFMILSSAAARNNNTFKVLNPYHGLTSERMVWMEYTDAHNALYHYLKDLGETRLAERAQKIAAIQTLSGWQKRQAEVKKMLQFMVGPLPTKTPLNAQVTGTVQRPGFTVEKILFESMPGFKVTGCLFLPKNRQDKAPAILYCSGHSSNGFRYQKYQNVVLNLVQKGFIVFAFDPIGQGERLQYFDPETGESRIGISVKEHSYSNNQCFMIGSSVARYFIRDGVRALDYLISRPEVDPARLGCHGNSGGGLQTACISAVDDRIKVAAVSGYITNYKWMLKSLGVQDGEQNLYQSWAHGFDIPDLIQVRAPKPMLVMATTRDFFPIRGAREAFAESQNIYRLYEQPDHLQKVEDDGRHGYTLKTRQAMYAFFQKHLNLPGDPREGPVQLFSDVELTVTGTGQVSTGPGSETVFSLNRQETQTKLEKLTESRQNPAKHCETVQAIMPEVAGYPDPYAKPVDAVMTGQYSDSLLIEKRFIEGVGDYPIPFVIISPETVTKKTVVLYLDPAGKALDPENQRYYQTFLEAGHIVVIPDLINTGEVGPTEFKGDATINDISSNIWYMAVQNATSIVGLRAADVNRLVNYLQQRFPERPVAGVSRSHFNVVLLHAAAMNLRIRAVAMFEPLLSFESMVMNEYYSMENLYAAPSGVIGRYDLPDLAACLAPRPIVMVNTLDQNGQAVSLDRAGQAYQFTTDVYQQKDAESNLVFLKDIKKDTRIFDSVFNEK